MSDFWTRLGRLRMLRVGAFYVGAAWVLLQIADQLEETLELPGWFDRVVLVLLLVGMPVVLFAAWAGGDSTTEPADAAAGLPPEPAGPAPAASASRMARPAVPDRPSIAVLPFTNMSADPEQAFLADGMTEDIITGLSLNRHLFVIARNTSFTYKDQAIDIRRIGQDLGVRYVLEGSVRRLGDRLRTTAQLIEAESGAHLWADKYDVPYADVFELQDDVIQAITTALGAQLTTAEGARARRAHPADLNAWEWVQRATHDSQSAMTDEGYRHIFDCLDRALAIDPDYPYALCLRAWVLVSSVINGIETDRAAGFRRAEEALALARSRAGDDPLCLFYVGAAEVYAGRPRDGIRALGLALERNPNSADALLHLGIAYGYVGEFEPAHECLDRARRLAPTGGWAFGHQWYRAIVLALEGRYTESLPLLDEFIGRNPDYAAPRLMRAIARAELGRTEAAREDVTHVARTSRTIRRDDLPPMMGAHPSPDQGRRWLGVLKALWPET